MFTGPPLPLSPDFPLNALARLAGSLAELGVWVRMAGNHVRVVTRQERGCCRILISRDLGLLLEKCSHVALREGVEPRLIEAELLIRWRALQVVTAIPCLPHPEHLQEIFPGAVHHPTGFSVPISRHPAEAVLADCITHGIPVSGSRVVYLPGAPP